MYILFRDCLLTHEIPCTAFRIRSLYESGITNRIAVLLVELDMSGDAVIGDSPESFIHCGRIRGTGCLQSFKSSIVYIISQCRNRCYGIVISVVREICRIRIDEFLDALVELGISALLIEGGDIDLNILALGRIQNNVGIPGVAGQQRDVKTLCRSLVDLIGSCLCGGRGEEYIAACIFGLCDVGSEITGPFREFSLYSLAAQLFECL